MGTNTDRYINTSIGSGLATASTIPAINLSNATAATQTGNIIVIRIPAIAYPNDFSFKDINLRDFEIKPLKLSYESSTYYEITKIEEIVENRVMRFYFADGSVIKTVCKFPDVFDLEYACYLAITKKLYKKELTAEGIEHKARELKYEIKYKKAVDKAIKHYNSENNEKYLKAINTKCEQIHEKNKAEKKRKRQERREAAKREKNIQDIAEAIRRSRGLTETSEGSNKDNAN